MIRLMTAFLLVLGLSACVSYVETAEPLDTALFDDPTCIETRSEYEVRMVPLLCEYFEQCGLLSSRQTLEECLDDEPSHTRLRETDPDRCQDACLAGTCLTLLQEAFEAEDCESDFAGTFECSGL